MARRRRRDGAPQLPLPLDAGWASDRLRARVYRDRQIRGAAWQVAMAVADHVRIQGQLYGCELGLSTIAQWTRLGERTIRRAVRDLESLGVLVTEHRGSHLRFVFRLEWVARWDAKSGQSGRSSDRKSGQSGRSRAANLAALGDASMYGVGNPVLGRAVAAGTGTAREVERHRRQQQQRRIDGLIPAAAIEARRLGLAFDEGDHRARLASGELTVDALQAHVDMLRAARTAADVEA